MRKSSRRHQVVENFHQLRVNRKPILCVRKQHNRRYWHLFEVKIEHKRRYYRNKDEANGEKPVIPSKRIYQKTHSLVGGDN